jgi:hypothetical protein
MQDTPHRLHHIPCARSEIAAQPPSGSKPQSLRLWQLALSAMLASACISAAAQDPGKHGLDYTYAPGSPQYWRGMHSTLPGNFVFRKDPHIWVVSPELARKAGLPLEWASEELQGVSAAAWRMQPGEEQCGWGGNPRACKRDMVCTLDLYFDRQTQALPWAPNRLVADFYWQDVSSAWHLLPSLGWAKEANGDVGRGGESSPNYPNLGKSPFADPKTGEELKWYWAELEQGGVSVIAYDREMHGRYSFVRLSDYCGGAEPKRPMHVELRRTAANNFREVISTHHSVRLPISWLKRVWQATRQQQKQADEFYQNIWKQLNKGDSK